MFVFLCGCHSNIFEGAPCSIIEFCHNAIWALFYVVAACVAAGTVPFAILPPQFTAGVVFAFFVAFLYIIHSFTSFRDWKGNYPCC